MQALIEIWPDGSVAIELDRAAARAMLARLAIAARFHKAFVSLAELVEAGLRNAEGTPKRRALCK